MAAGTWRAPSHSARPHGVVGNTLLALDLLLQLRDLVFDARSARLVSAAQVALGVGQALLQRLQHTLRRGKLLQAPAQARQALLERNREIDPLAAPETKGHLGVGVERDRDDRLLIPESAGPFLLTNRSILDAVGGHDEQQAIAGANGAGYLLVPILARL